MIPELHAVIRHSASDIVRVRLYILGHCPGDGLVNGIEVVFLCIEVVYPFLVPYPEKNKKTAGHAKGKAKDIDTGI